MVFVFLILLNKLNREIVAYIIADKQDTPLVLDTFHQLPSHREMMLHSNQGSVYTSLSRIWGSVPILFLMFRNAQPHPSYTP